jgi:hypothetical protein
MFKGRVNNENSVRLIKEGSRSPNDLADCIKVTKYHKNLSALRHKD